jgi:hypothetical protein
MKGSEFESAPRAFVILTVHSDSSIHVEEICPEKKRGNLGRVQRMTNGAIGSGATSTIAIIEVD